MGTFCGLKCFVTYSSSCLQHKAMSCHQLHTHHEIMTAPSTSTSDKMPKLPPKPHLSKQLPPSHSSYSPPFHKERPCLLPPTPLRKVKGLCPLEGSAFPPARAQPLAYIPPLRIGAFLPRGSPFLGLLDLIIDACRAVHKNKE
uniref:Uncharacterized protein n=1 Tax=Timema monikensis TaxID=170555 RepID=A0A7R9E843_9NEOP|nr:unnamed protein product [Timema monikensis]